MASEIDTPTAIFAMVPSEVTDAGVYLQQVAESLINGLNSLDREVSTVLGNWSGAAADAFGEGWTETKKGAADVLAALGTMGEILGFASKAAADQDVSSSEDLNSIDIPKLKL